MKITAFAHLTASVGFAALLLACDSTTVHGSGPSTSHPGNNHPANATDEGGISKGDASTSNGNGSDSTVVLRSNLQYDETPNVSDRSYQTLILGNRAFAFDLFTQLKENNGDNLVYSPLSASIALAMTYAGARNETAGQMARALHFGIFGDTLHAAFNQLTLELASRNVAVHATGMGDKSVELGLTDALWAQQGLTLVPDFLDTLSLNYNAGVHLLDFSADPDGSRVSINGWVSNQTRDKITDLLAPGDVDSDTQLVLIDTLYLRASWANAFDTQGTAPAVFHTLASGDVNVPMMSEIGEFNYSKGNYYQVVDLPYDKDKLSMRIVLPRAGEYDTISSELSAVWMDTVDQAMHKETVEVRLPKFNFKWGTTSLRLALQALGMTDPFSSNADFSGMTNAPLHIRDVLQQAFISVDESGTEAAAATAVTVADGGITLSPHSVEADRPFFFFIRDQSGAVLFMGQVTNPTSTASGGANASNYTPPAPKPGKQRRSMQGALPSQMKRNQRSIWH